MKAKKVYVCNVMTQPGETTGYSAYDHIKAINDHTGMEFVDYCIVNTGDIPMEYIDKYKAENAEKVVVDEHMFENTSTKLIQKDLLYLDKLLHLIVKFHLL